MKKTFRLGFIGAGFVAKFQAKALTHCRGIDLAGVHAQKGAEELAGFANANDLGDCRVYPSIAELCKNCDAVAMFVPNMARIEVMEQIAAARQAGANLKGVLCEKPLGRTVAEAAKMAELAGNAQLLTSYLENQIFMKAIRMALAQMAAVAAKMGPLTLFRGAEEHHGPHEGWFWDPTRQGGGVLSDMGCHSIGLAWYCLTPFGKPIDFLIPVEVSAVTKSLKWGREPYRSQLLQQYGVDYRVAPAEDYTAGTITFMNPETEQRVTGQFQDSWMFDMLGLRLFAEGLGPDYAFKVDSLNSPLEVFIGDAAAASLVDGEAALEKATATRGLLKVQPNEPDLYGYVDELLDAARSFQAGHDAELNFGHGLRVTELVQACYLAAESGQTLNLFDPAVKERLRTYQSAISRGKGHKVLGLC
jgi:predicted dehydrogenase